MSVRRAAFLDDGGFQEAMKRSIAESTLAVAQGFGLTMLRTFFCSLPLRRASAEGVARAPRSSHFSWDWGSRGRAGPSDGTENS